MHGGRFPTRRVGQGRPGSLSLCVASAIWTERAQAAADDSSKTEGRRQLKGPLAGVAEFGAVAFSATQTGST